MKNLILSFGILFWAYNRLRIAVCIITLVFAAFMFGCGTDAGGRNAGIAISFDDHFIDKWYGLRPLFNKYGAKVTFFITCNDTLSTKEIWQLKQLELDGHEIGFHGTIHGKSTELIVTGVDNYIKTELTPGLHFLNMAGFKPTSYAHPGGNHNDRVDSVLLANEFKIIRDVAVSKRELYGIPIYRWAPKGMNNIYYKSDKENDVAALLIDYGSGVTVENMEAAIEKSKRTNTILMIFGHEPLHEPPAMGAYGFDIRLFESILDFARKQNLKYYRMSDLPDL